MHVEAILKVNVPGNLTRQCEQIGANYNCYIPFRRKIPKCCHIILNPKPLAAPQRAVDYVGIINLIKPAYEVSEDLPWNTYTPRVRLSRYQVDQIALHALML
ncbi:MAG: hypothetical protein ACYC6C_07215, partial [Coriobacteriia bacterium]